MIYKSPILIVKIEDEGFHPHLPVKVNNKEALVLLDSGASKTVFDIQLINNYIEGLKSEKHDKFTTGLGTNSMESHKTFINKLEIGEVAILDWDAVLLDLSHVNNSYRQLGIPEIIGVIGCDLLMKYKARVDFNKAILTLKT